MKNLNEIKEFLKNSKKEPMVILKNSRFKTIEVVRVDDKTIHAIMDYEDIVKASHIINHTIIHFLEWYENGKVIEVIVARKED